MSLMRRLFPEMRQLQREMEGIFSPVLRPMGRARAATPLFDEPFLPVADIHETKDKFVIQTELPGVSKDEIAMEVTDNNQTIVIRGETKPKGKEGEQKEGTPWSRERMFGSFLRSFSLPSAIKPESIEASLKDGVLHLELPKTEQQREQLQVNWKE